MPVPERIAQAARQRLLDSATQIERSISAIQLGRPLEAEPDGERLKRRVRAVTGLGGEEAASLLRGDPAPLRRLIGEARRGAERIQGQTEDFVGVSFLQLAQAAASGVGRVIFRNDAPQGSGFMVSPRLFLTNNHVLSSREAAAGFLVEFDYELDVFGQERASTRFEFNPAAFFCTNTEDDLDYTVIAVGSRAQGDGELAHFGYCPLLRRDDKHALGEVANIVQHPEGDFKQVVLRENRWVNRLSTVLHYIADTLPGSSGSPVFNDEWQVVALHHWGEPFREWKLPNGQVADKNVNEGIRISAIAADLADLLTEPGALGAPQRELLAHALEPASSVPSLLSPSESRASNQSTIRTPETNAMNIPTNALRPDSPTPDDAGNAVSVTIPLQITVRLLPPAPPAIQSLERADTPASGAEAVQIDTNYANRNGYNPRFLPGFVVPLPGLSTGEMKSAAAKVRGVAEGENPHELKYQHFSIVMNGERRMAFFTATNIDGATWKNIDRETGQAEGAEASEKWYADPRIAEDAQSDQSLYSSQRPRRVFDRGHLTRRLDPCWGTAARAERANADTFHFTNCTPQESRFNQQSRYWQGIEEYVLDNAKAEREKVTVFTGPVFGSDDPPYRYAQMPLQFWKVLARVEDGELLATALLADQSPLLSRLPERLGGESFGDLGRVEEYQTSVAEIERLTGLDFGVLRDHDTVRANEAGVSLREVQAFADITLARGARR